VTLQPAIFLYCAISLFLLYAHIYLAIVMLKIMPASLPRPRWH